jgi:hypothetical protein
MFVLTLESKTRTNTMKLQTHKYNETTKGSFYLDVNFKHGNKQALQQPQTTSTYFRGCAL